GMDYLYSTNSGEGGASFQLQETAFSVFPSAQACDRPLYRCRYAGGHFLSNQATCEGFASEGRLGYVCKDSSATTQTLYPLLNGSGAHTVVVQWSEAQALIAQGWKYESVLGYAPVLNSPEKNNLVLALIDLQDKDMVAKKFTTKLVLDFAPLKAIYPSDWMN